MTGTQLLQQDRNIVLRNRRINTVRSVVKGIHFGPYISTGVESTDGPLTPSSIVDMIFIQDLSGSFSGDLNNIVQFYNQLIPIFGTSEFPATDVQIGMTSFEGDPPDIPYRKDLDFTTTYSLLSTTAESYTTDGGDETQRYAIIESINDYTFRNNSHRILILITDEDDTQASGIYLPPLSSVQSNLNDIEAILIIMTIDSLISYYENFLVEIDNSRGTVVEIDSNASNMLSAFTTAIANSVGV